MYPLAAYRPPTVRGRKPLAEWSRKFVAHPLAAFQGRGFESGDSGNVAFDPRNRVFL